MLPNHKCPYISALILTAEPPLEPMPPATLSGSSRQMAACWPHIRRLPRDNWMQDARGKHSDGESAVALSPYRPTDVSSGGRVRSRRVLRRAQVVAVFLLGHAGLVALKLWILFRMLMAHVS